MIVVWVSSSFGYYLISYQVKYLKGNLYLNGVILTLSEVAAYALSVLIFKKLGLKLTFVLSYALAALGMLCLIFLKTENKYIIGMFIIGCRFGVSQTFNLAFIGNQMLFSISIVATSFGFCNAFARFATIFAPYVAELHPPSISMWIFFFVMIVALTSSMFLRK